MGLSSSKTKNEPWKQAQPYILKGLQQSGEVFDQQQPSLNKFSAMQMDTYGRLAPGAEQGIMGSQGLVNDTLSGKYLNGNPYLDGMINKTRENITNNVQSQFAGAGRYGSDYNVGELSRQLSDAENQMRFQNYAQERGYQNQAVDQAQSLMNGSQGLLNNAAELPWIGVGALNGNVRQASNGYGVTKQTGNIGQQLLAGASAAAAAYAGSPNASDIRLKTNIEKVGEYPDGLGIYDFDYLPIEGQIAAFMPEGRQRGVMAHEVAALRPDALGPVIDGYATVNYGAL
jgi:hypothetical protein